jgi:hypothetical protein
MKKLLFLGLIFITINSFSAYQDLQQQSVVKNTTTINNDWYYRGNFHLAVSTFIVPTASCPQYTHFYATGSIVTKTIETENMTITSSLNLYHEALIGTGTITHFQIEDWLNYSKFDDGYESMSIGKDTALPTSGFNNIFLGYSAGNANAGGLNNTYSGAYAGYYGLVGNNCSLYGYGAGYNNLADDNSFFGSDAGDYNTIGTKNTFMGRAAGLNNVSGSSNTYVGYNAGSTTTTIMGGIALGYMAKVGANNECQIGGSNLTAIRTSADIYSSRLILTYGLNASTAVITGIVNIVPNTDALLTIAGSGAVSKAAEIQFRGTKSDSANVSNTGRLRAGYSGTTYDSSYLGFWVLNVAGSDIEALRIANAGNVTVPLGNFSVGGSTFVIVNGNVGISSSTPQYLLTMETGSGGGYYSSADHQWHNGVSYAKYKENILDLNNPISLTDLKKVKLRKYNYIGKNKLVYGYLADELPLSIQKYVVDSNGGLSMNGLFIYFTSVMQKQQTVIEKQQKKINELEKRISIIEKKLGSIK